jgi:hypothetical protein
MNNENQDCKICAVCVLRGTNERGKMKEGD